MASANPSRAFIKFSVPFRLGATALWSLATLVAWVHVIEGDVTPKIVIAVVALVLAVPGIVLVWSYACVIDEHGAVHKLRPGRGLGLPYDVRWDSPVIVTSHELFGGSRALGLFNPESDDRPRVFIVESMRPVAPLLRAVRGHAVSFDDLSLQRVEEFVDHVRRSGIRHRLRARLARARASFAKWWERTRWAWLGR